MTAATENPTGVFVSNGNLCHLDMNMDEKNHFSISDKSRFDAHITIEDSKVQEHRCPNRW